MTHSDKAEKMGMLRGWVSDVQRFSLDDGPGIRTVVFMKGCNLSCAWCHNPESIRGETQLSKLESLCTKCGCCRYVCENGAVSMIETEFRIMRERCTVCGKCVEACPAGSLKITGYSIAAAELLQTLLKDDDYYKASGGGVTFSGGEPAMQPEFLLEMLRICKSAGLHTTLNTNGAYGIELAEILSPLVDYVMIDLKHVDDKKHREYTGAGCEHTKRSLAYYAARNNMEARVPVIPCFNSEPGELQAILDFLGECNVPQATFLPYHTYGIGKYKSLGMVYSLAEIPALSAEILQCIVEKLNCRSINVKVLGK